MSDRYPVETRERESRHWGSVSVLAIGLLLSTLHEGAIGGADVSESLFSSPTCLIDKRGRELLEGSGHATNWELWTELFVALRDGKYRPKADQADNLGELEKMKLIERTVRLKA